MKVGGKSEDKTIPKIDIIKGSFHNPQKDKKSRKEDLEKLEKERRSKLN